MTNPRDNSKAIGADGGRRSSRRRRSQTSLNLRNAFRSDQSTTTSGSSSSTPDRTATSSSSSSVHGEGDVTAHDSVQIDGRDGRLSRSEMLDILQAAIEMSNEGLVARSDSGRSSSGTDDDYEEDSGNSPMQ